MSHGNVRVLAFKPFVRRRVSGMTNKRYLRPDRECFKEVLPPTANSDDCDFVLTVHNEFVKKILLATGIFYPDVGGPAIHARHIADEIVKHGGRVRVITYGGAFPVGTVLLPYPVTRIPLSLWAPLRWALYALAALKDSLWAEVIYAFDLSAAGVPAACAATLTGKKFFIRIGGDPLWERVVEHGKRFLSLDEYYAHGYYLTDRPFLFRLIRWVLSRTDYVITYAQMLADLYTKYFNVPPEHIHIIPNPFPAVPSGTKTLTDAPLTLYAGRFVKYKNLPFVLRVFRRIHTAHPASRLMLVGSGPEFTSVKEYATTLALGDALQILPAVPHEQLREFQARASLALAPALTEFSPNFALEALATGTPILISRGNGLTVQLPEECLFDPSKEDELYERWNALLDPVVYAKVVQEVIASIPHYTWTEVEAAHAVLLGL
ncbi:MAG TPA: hypothetical protein DCZ84_03090 [Candidatus Vogelbacteria bacterium]|nr:hypothetical protein [Candidatus Vogelbacteria bacterium]